MQTIRGISASIASSAASAAMFAGTKMILAFAPVAFTASITVLNTGTGRLKRSSFLPEYIKPFLPGVTPPTTFVP